MKKERLKGGLTKSNQRATNKGGNSTTKVLNSFLLSDSSLVRLYSTRRYSFK